MNKFFVLMMICLIMVACSDDKSRLAEDPGAINFSEDGESRDSVEVQIQSIRKLYNAAMQLKASKLEFNCADDPLSGSLEIRNRAGELVWLRYMEGYDHGMSSYEALMDNGKILFILKEGSSWQFDNNGASRVDGPADTLDTTEQERYYFQDDSMIRSLYKKALARSKNKESIEKKISQTSNQKHPHPQPAEALQKIRALLRAQKSGRITTQWCGLELK